MNFATDFALGFGHDADMSMAHLKTLLLSHGVTQTQLARVLGRDKSAVTNLLQGKRQLKADEVIKIADFLQVSEADVLGTRAAGAPPTSPPASFPVPAASPAGHAVAAGGLEDAVRIPFFAPPSASVTQNAPLEQEGSAFYLEETGQFSPQSFALEVKDESMNLSGFISGDIVICDPSAAATEGRIVIVQQYTNDAAETLIRLYKPPFLLPHSTHQGFPRLHDERANVRIVAPVVKLVRWLR